MTLQPLLALSSNSHPSLTTWSNPFLIVIEPVPVEKESIEKITERQNPQLIPAASKVVQ